MSVALSFVPSENTVDLLSRIAMSIVYTAIEFIKARAP
jgi:hypothetical protein